jgi:hypothetical protein
MASLGSRGILDPRTLTDEDITAGQQLLILFPEEPAARSIADERSHVGMVNGFDVFATADLAVDRLSPLSGSSKTESDLLSLARAFQAAVSSERAKDKYQSLEDHIRRSHCKLYVWARPSPTDSTKAWYANVIGDDVQRHYEKRDALRQECVRHELLSGSSEAQHAVAVWLNLPVLICKHEMPASIASWNKHQWAALNEELTLYLPARLFHAYMFIQAHFRRLCLMTGTPARMCVHVDESTGICFKTTLPNSKFCGRHSN